MDHDEHPDAPTDRPQEGSGGDARPPAGRPEEATESEARPPADGPAAAPDGERPPADPSSPAPERLCRRCSTVTATAGAFCPHCGASYVRRRRMPRPGRRTTAIVAAILVVVLVAGGGTGLVLKGRADDRAERREQAQRDARERQERAQRKAQEAADARDAAAAEAADAEENLQQELRELTVRELRKAVTKDAQGRFAEGVLEDRARSTSCENTDGNEDDLAETSAAYSCIAVTDEDADGGSRGYRFTARVDFEEGSYTWHLGD